MAPFEKDTSLWYTQIWLYFIFNLNLSILKISPVKREWLTNLNFGSPILGRSPYFGIPKFCKILFYLHNYQP